MLNAKAALKLSLPQIWAPNFCPLQRPSRRTFTTLTTYVHQPGPAPGFYTATLLYSENTLYGLHFWLTDRFPYYLRLRRG